MATILLAGGTGMVGTRLTQLLLQRGFEVIILSRSPKTSQTPGLSYAVWNVEQQMMDDAVLQKASIVINLAGAGVADKRWTAKRKQEILDSRTKAGATLVKYLTHWPNQVHTVINASAIGWYGPDATPPKGFSENDTACIDFLGSTCAAWEQSIAPVAQLGKRLVICRIGIVMSTTGGALQAFMQPMQTRVAAIMGNGQQMVSWIHVDDLCHLFIHAMENKAVEGVFNAVAPNPVTNRQLVQTLAKQKLKKWYLLMPVPAFLLQLILGEMSIEVLKSCTVRSQKIEQTGFQFQYPTIAVALQHLLSI